MKNWNIWLKKPGWLADTSFLIESLKPFSACSGEFGRSSVSREGKRSVNMLTRRSPKDGREEISRSCRNCSIKMSQLEMNVYDTNMEKLDVRCYKELPSNVSYSRNSDVSHLHSCFHFSFFIYFFTTGPSQPFCQIAAICSTALDNPSSSWLSKNLKPDGDWGEFA